MTAELKRPAFQIVIQLPEEAVLARTVLDYVRDLIEWSGDDGRPSDRGDNVTYIK